MAVLTATGLSRVALNLLYRSLALPRTVTRVPGEEFAGPNGSTITLRVPQPGTAQTDAPGNPLTPADVTEVPVDVTLGHVYHLKNITDDEASMDLENFARQVSRVQVGAVAIGVEDKLAAAMNGLPASAIEFATSATEADTKATVLAARELLGENDVPAGDRFLAVAPSIATRLLSVEDFVRADASGSTDALRNAVIGRIFGFTVVESNALTTDTAVAYHRSGFGLAVRAPMIPRGANDAATISDQGIGMRQVFQYDASKAQDQSLVSTFAGAAAVADQDSPSSDGDYPRAIKLTVTEASSGA